GEDIEAAVAAVVELTAKRGHTVDAAVVADAVQLAIAAHEDAVAAADVPATEVVTTPATSNTGRATSSSGQAVMATSVLPRAFGPYTLVERLGSGGMAEVFLATRGGTGGFEKK